MRRLALLAVALTAVLAAPAAAHSPAHSPFPKLIALPVGFQPEGIALKGPTFYVGSIPTGSIDRGDARTGSGDVLVPPQTGAGGDRAEGPAWPALGRRRTDRQGIHL